MDYGLIDSNRFRCPYASGDKECDYFYFPIDVRSVEYPDRAVIACDYRDNHNGEDRSALYADYHVVRLKEDDFQKELARPENATFAETLRKAEGVNTSSFGGG